MMTLDLEKLERRIAESRAIWPSGDPVIYVWASDLEALIRRVRELEAAVNEVRAIASESEGVTGGTSTARLLGETS